VANVAVSLLSRAICNGLLSSSLLTNNTRIDSPLFRAARGTTNYSSSFRWKTILEGKAMAGYLGSVFLDNVVPTGVPNRIL
jgi:hypothetical protein